MRLKLVCFTIFTLLIEMDDKIIGMYEDYDDFIIDVSNVTIEENYQQYVYFAKGTVKVYSTIAYIKVVYCGFTKNGPTEENIEHFVAHISGSSFKQGTDDNSVNYFTCGVKYNNNFYFQNIAVENNTRFIMIGVIVGSIVIIIAMCFTCYGYYSSKLKMRNRAPSQVTTLVNNIPISSVGVNINTNQINYTPIYYVNPNESVLYPYNTSNKGYVIAPTSE